MVEILFLGPKSSGKSLLIKRMQALSEDKRISPFDQIALPKPTEGTNAINFNFRGTTFVFKELGGDQIEDWEHHAKTPKAIIYVFDAADLTMTATNIVFLQELLSSKVTEDKPILIALSKCDIPDFVHFNVIDEIIGFDAFDKKRISFMETSAVVGVGLDTIFEWIADQMK
ncbi:hypothetical protein TVAG_038360 [Trichomonas vaginalis G3]|uniref:Small GTP-binding protein n=1 Tax=Trichomonas vaginalis (strain ATCC PRA-98 / G3) TaxID=412133 RepID=A2DXZ4_TRIV3|nr:GTP binding [Trichomonas vaginalis G3]EAY14730.1 hypothetical protein TVAG_038360 [Trichomonas vaginalis G3]KAI5487899.1 GTP binding [Trichomonas vaginalis G3]|eukprot:XP_001326953.1 hypothetical protein [Trichomonas vaginalis G3]